MALARQSIGIILMRPAPGKRVVWLLDREWGHIRALLDARLRMPVLNGAVMTYTITEQGDQFLVTDMCVEQLPVYHSLLALQFGHHLLQIMHAALPQGYVDQQLFADVVMVFAHLDILGDDYERQQLVLGKLSAWMGLILPEHPAINRLMHTPIESLLTMVVASDLAQQAHMVVMRSLITLPGTAKLQYIQFIKGQR
ncbi:hypothetical protein M1466_03055 [Candidatus Dependentiae bacterium]|nr:hypothetical protein [Candidatus Dependentiae bacterium]